MTMTDVDALLDDLERPTLNELYYALPEHGVHDDRRDHVMHEVHRVIDIQNDPAHDDHEWAFKMGFEDIVKHAIEGDD